MPIWVLEIVVAAAAPHPVLVATPKYSPPHGPAPQPDPVVVVSVEMFSR